MTDPTSLTWALILHGGARSRPPAADEEAAERAGCRAALLAGRDILAAGGAALDAAVACVKAMEDDPTFNAGFGSALSADGAVEMDAGVMDGATLDVGAVAALAGVRNPVLVAKRLLGERSVLLAGDGARRFAAAHGLELCDPAAMIAPRRAPAAARGCDTVGCLALDRAGHVAAATSTGGIAGKPPGRVGDTPLAGAGFYADDARGAAAFSGEGEAVIRLALAAQVMRWLETGDAQTAADRALARLAALGAQGGAIVLDRAGRVGWAHNGPSFAVAFATSDAPEPIVHLRRDGTGR